MYTITTPVHRIITALALLALSACGDSSIFGPDNELGITNNTDQFSLQAQTLADLSGTDSYDWVVTTASASVSHSNAALSADTATLTILDADGTQVYSAPLSDASNGEDTTASGTAGTWTVTVTMNGATTDHINFQLADVP
jgi:hypothetical protein